MATKAAGLQLTIDVSGVAFFGYFELSGVDDVPDELRFFSRPLVADRHHAAGVYSEAEVNAAYGLVGVERLPGRGHLLVYPHDCDGTPAPGVRLVLNDDDNGAEVVTFYFGDNFLPDPDLEETQLGDNRGGGFSNVPPGLHTARAIEVSSKREVASARVRVRADALTVLVLEPTP